MIDWKQITRENLLFVLVDFQEKFFPILDPAIVRLVKANLLLLVRTLQAMNVPLIGTEHYVKGLGPTDGDVLRAWGDAPMTGKVTFSCCRDEAFLANLDRHSRPVVAVAGLETQICVLQTVLDLRDRGYEVLVLKDAVVSTTKLKWENGLELMRDAGAHILNTDTLLFYLLQRVDTPEFKHFLKLLKEQQAFLAG